MKKFLLSLATVALGFGFAQAADITDVINQAATGISGTGYKSANITTTNSGAEYAVQCAGDKGSVQMRSNNNNSGIVSTKSGGTVKSVSITWEPSTAAARVVNIYASASAYTNPTDLYAQGLEYVGQLKRADATEGNGYVTKLDIPGDYQYVGVRSASGAVYLMSVDITWDSNATPPAVALPVISCADNKVTITAEEGADVYYTLDGTEPTAASTKYEIPFPITETVTVKAIAVKGSDQSKVATYTANYVGAYADFASLVAAGKGTSGMVSGPVTAIYQNGSNLYMKDSKGGYMLLFGSAGQTGLVNGDTFSSVSAAVGEYGGQPQLVAPITLGIKSTGAAVEAEELGLDEFSAELVYHYVKIVGVNFTNTNGTSRVNFSITDADGNTLQGRNNFNLDLADGENFTVYGFVTVYNGTVQLYPVSVNGGTELEKVATPVFNPASGEIQEGSSVSIACATASAKIYYTLDGSKPSVSSTPYNGTPIVINETTTVKAIAVADGMSDSEVATATYTVVPRGTLIATFNFTADGNIKSLTTDNTFAPANQNVDENALLGRTFINGPITMWVSLTGESGNGGRWWSASQGQEARVYGGSTINVSVNSNGYRITSVAFTQNTGSTNWMADQEIVASSKGDVVEGGEWTAANKTWTAPAAIVTDFALKLTGKSGRDSFAALTVNFVRDDAAQSAVDNIAADNDENAPVEYYNLQGVRVQNPSNGLYIVKQGNKVSKQLIR